MGLCAACISPDTPMQLPQQLCSIMQRSYSKLTCCIPLWVLAVLTVLCVQMHKERHAHSGQVATHGQDPKQLQLPEVHIEAATHNSA